jgi:hypothetical protein
MSTVHALGKVFFHAFRTMDSQEKEYFLEELLKDKKYREDLIDIALIEARRNEPSRSFREYLSERK